MEALDSDFCGGSYGRYVFDENQQKSDVILIKVNLKPIITQLQKSILYKQKGSQGKKASHLTNFMMSILICLQT